MNLGLNIRILQWNVQGFIAHKYALETLVAKHKPSIVALQETHIVDRNKHLLHLPGYNIYHHNKDYQYAKAGIMLLIRRNIQVDQHLVSCGDLLFQTVTINGNEKIHITNIYRECDVNPTSSMMSTIHSFDNGHHLVLGDLNSQNPIWGSHSLSASGTLWEEFADDKGLVILNNGSPTLLSTRGTLTSVDVTMASADLAPHLMWTTLDMPEVGDHYPILISDNNSEAKRHFRPRFLVEKANWQDFQDKVILILPGFEESSNINKEAAQIKRIIRKASNETIPQTSKPKDNNSPAWFNPYIAGLVVVKQRTWNIFLRHRSIQNSISYRRACAKVKYECIIAKRKTWENFLNSLNPMLDFRVLWSRVRGIRTEKIFNFPSIIEGNTTLTHSIDIANKFAEVWSSIGSDDRFELNIISRKNNFINQLNTYDGTDSLLCTEIDIVEFNDTLKNTKGNTPSLDRITYSMIKNLPLAMKNRIIRLYNNILRTGIFPHDWKTALLTPIPKPGKSPNKTDGYRPISLIPVLSKVLEKIISTRFWKYYKGRISPSHHAFLPKHGVHTICHELESKLRENLSRRRHSVVLSEDIEKAFDRVVSIFVIDELKDWGISLPIINLIFSFLSNRKIMVKIDGYISLQHPLDNGIPQGSPLSVILFTIYANSLAKSIQNLPGIDYVGLYADNIFAVASGTQDEVSLNINLLNEKIQHWAITRGAVIPVTKSEILHVCRRRNCNVDNLPLGGTLVPLTNNLKILGLHFAKNLLWNNHVAHLRIKLNRINNLLRLICSKKKGPHIETANSICSSLVYGVLQHCITIYGWTNKTNVGKLNTALNNCFRTSSGLLKVTPIESLRMECRITDFNTLLNIRSVNMASRNITDPKEGLHHLFWNYIDTHALNKKPCAIQNIVFLLMRHNIPLPNRPETRINSNSMVTIDNSLAIYKKSTTNSEVFKTLVLEKISNFTPDIILFTDGSYQNGVNGYAVVQQIDVRQYTTIKQGLLPAFSGIFAAEFAAINSAILFAAKRKLKAIICTDSLSVITALLHNKREIYDNFIKNPAIVLPIQLLWVPSHFGIGGNEFADNAAKEVIRLPMIFETPCFNNIIINIFRTLQTLELRMKWTNSQSFLRSHNANYTRPKYHYKYTRYQCIILARLRVGKALFNSKHYYDNSDHLQCHNCGCNMDIRHVLVECPISKVDEPLEIILDCSKHFHLSKILQALSRQAISDV